MIGLVGAFWPGKCGAYDHWFWISFLFRLFFDNFLEKIRRGLFRFLQHFL